MTLWPQALQWQLDSWLLADQPGVQILGTLGLFRYIRFCTLSVSLASACPHGTRIYL